jgi:hypothetical protein
MNQISIPSSQPSPPAGFEYNPGDAASIAEIIHALQTGQSSGVRFGPAHQLLPGRTPARPGGYVAAGVEASVTVVACFAHVTLAGTHRVAQLKVQTRRYFTPRTGANPASKPRWVNGGGSGMLVEYRRGG